MKNLLRRQILVRLLQCCMTFGLITWLCLTIDWLKLSQTMQQLHWEWLGVSLFSVGVSHLLNVVRWQLLPNTPRLRFSDFFAMYGAGLFGNSFLPTGIGGDGIRVVLLRRYVPITQAIFSVGLDRILGFAGLSGLLLPGLYFGLPPQLLSAVSFDTAHLGIVAGIATVTSLACACSWYFLPQFRSSIQKILCHIAIYRTMGLRQPCRWVYALGVAYALSVLSQIVLAVAYWYAFQALRLSLSPGATIWLMFAATAALLLPISVNGLGLQESVFVVVLGAYGVAAPAALGVALIIRALMTFYSLLGGLISLRQGWAKQQQEPQAVSNRQ